MSYGYWQHEDLWNGKYTIADWFDIMDVIAEAEPRKMKMSMMGML